MKKTFAAALLLAAAPAFAGTKTTALPTLTMSSAQLPQFNSAQTPGFGLTPLSPLVPVIPTDTAVVQTQVPAQTILQDFQTRLALPADQNDQGQDAQFHAGAMRFDGAKALENQAYAPRMPQGDGRIAVPYARTDWNLHFDAQVYKKYSELAASHRAAFLAGAPNTEELGNEVAAHYYSLMQSAGVNVQPIRFKGFDGVETTGVQIVPDAKGHRLNRIAARLSKNSLVKTVYAPRVTALAAAQFAIVVDTPYLFAPNLDMPWTAEALRHELRHYGFFRKLLSGRLSFLHSYFTPKPGLQTAPDALAYHHYIALEEVATYSQQVRDMLRVLAKNPSGEGAEEIMTQLRILKEVARIARHITQSAREEQFTAPLAANPINDKAAFLEVSLAGGRLAFAAHPALVSDEVWRRRTLRQRLDAWDRLLDVLQPLVDELQAPADAPQARDWKALSKRADKLNKLLAQTN